MRVLIKISDPWELGELTGWQPINATLVRFEVMGDLHARALIEFDTPIEVGGAVWSYAIASPRSHESRLDAVSDGVSVSANFVGISQAAADSANPFDADEWRGGLGFIADVCGT